MQEKRSVLQAIFSGLREKCPNCQSGSLYYKFLKVNDQCSTCREMLHHHRADDAPPYFTIFIVGHILLPLMIWVEIAYKPSLWVHNALWLPATLIICYWLLPRVKGALIGFQWANYMHGFDPQSDEPL